MNLVIRRVLFFALAILLLVTLLGLPDKVNAVRFTGRVTNDNYALCYRIPVDAGRNLDGDLDLKVSMIALTGDLVPFVVLRSVEDGSALKRSEGSSEGRTELTYAAETSGDIEIVATRTDVEAGTTVGEFLLLVEGSESAIVPSSPVDPCLQTQPTLFASNELSELPRPQNGQPAVLLPINTTVTGVINSQFYVVYYLIDGKQARSYKIEMFRSQDGGGDLLPFMGILRLDKKEGVLIRSKNRSDTSTSIEFNPQDFPGSADERWFVLAVSRVDVETGTTTGKYQLSVKEN